MKYTEAEIGRVFIVRLEDGDRLPEVIENFAIKEKIAAAVLLFVGGADKDSQVVVGPEEGEAATPVPMIRSLPGVSEAVGAGTIFLNEQGIPRMHLHSAFGRETGTITGCTRAGVNIWRIGEVVIWELKNHPARRKKDTVTGFELLDV